MSSRVGATAATIVVLVVLAALVGAGFSVLAFNGIALSTRVSTTTVTLISDQTSIQTSTRTVTDTSIAITGSSSLSGRLYQVAFYENSTCGSLYTTPWGVTLGGVTILEPSNATLSQMAAPGKLFLQSSYFNMTTIVFSVPNGVYNFTLYPQSYTDAVGASSETTTHGPNGTVTVNNSDVSVYAIPVAPPPTSCTQ